MQPRYRITHVVTVAGPDPALGGPLRVALDQARELQSRGHDVTLLGGWDDSRPGPSHLEDVPAVLVPVRVLAPRYALSSRMSVGVYRAIKAWVRSSDVVHVHLGRDAVPLLAAIQAARAGTPYVVQTHGMIHADSRLLVRAVDAVATRRALAGATHRLVLTDVEDEELREVSPAATTRLRNGIPLSCADMAARTTTGVPEVLFLGRLHPNKQPLVFARAARALHDEGVEARFVVVGPDHGERDRLRRFISENETESYLTYEGSTPVSESRRRLAAADVFVQPTVSEPFGLSALQAMAEGVPSIVTTGFAIAPELRRYGGAMIVEPTVQGVAQAVRRLLADAEQRAVLGQRGYEVIRQHFSMAAVVDGLERIYAEALQTGDICRPGQE